MWTKGILVFVLVSTALAIPQDPYQAPTQNSYKPQQQQSYEKLMPYNFNYAVRDEYSGNDYAQQEVADEEAVKGSYTVQLPDGRKQTVTYVADYDGTRAEVTYEGEAQYPKEYGPPITFKPQAYGSQPSYKAEPSYQPKPSYQPQPAYQPQPTYQPKPSYKPKPSYQPKPSYKPKPSYQPKPSY